ncbi:unnamed protein product [Bubo scandiacus]
MSERPASHPRVALEEVEAAQESSSLPELCDVSMVQLLQADGTLPEQENPEHPDLQAGRDADSTRLPPSLDSSDVMLVFEESLQPSQATDTVLVATEGPTADDFCARQMGSNVLDMAVRDPESWLMDARKMQVLLPDIMETLRHANTDVKMKSLVFFRNMMGHVKRKEASLIALQLAEKLLPLFDDESSQLREISIRLFKDVMKTVVGRQKKKMAKKVQSVLLPLFLHRNDQIKSVAKASRDTFVACTEFLGWRMANYMPEPYHTHLIGEFLLAHDRSRVEEYLCQSLPYLEDTQASMREAAVRFIGLGVKHPRNISKKKMREICNDGTLPEQENPEHPDLQAGRDADSTRLPPSLDSSDVMLVFEESLQPSQATDTVLVATEGPTADDFYARQMGSNVLDMAVRDPESWLMDARKMQVLLPDIMETLRHANTDVKMKSLVFFRNMMGHVKRKEASLIALQLAEKLLPLFDDESSQLREISIRLFKDVMKTVVGRQKKKMAKKVQSVLLPLFLHRNDQIKSVAKASRDTFVACTEFLGWRMANYMPEPYHTHLIGEFLLAHDRSRVEEYLCQSLPYLEDTQASMREAAVRFIGLGVKHPRNISKKKMREICNDGTLPEQENPEHPDLQAGRDADSTRLPPSLDSSDVMLVFEESLQPSQATDTVLVATEGPTADDFCARQMGSNVLDMAVRDPESWLMDARKMQVLLPDIMETLRHANTDVKMKSLVFFRNMMGHVKRKEASLIALQLAEKLLPLFDDESSQLREISIRLFKDVMKTVVGRQKKKMAKKVQSVLLPLFLHRNDQIKSVAKASRDTFVACTEFLGWRMANYMPEPYHTHLIGEFLLAHDRSRVEEYLCQSLPYLEDTQASMREAAVRFIGLGVKHPRNISKKKMREICNDGTLPEQENPEHPDLQAGRDADSTRLPPSLDSSDVMLVFEESLQPSQATDTVLVATEGPTADDFYARQMGSNVLDMAVRDPESWLMDARKMQVLLPDIMETLRHANTDVKMKSLVFFRNMMGHVKRKEASLIALQLAEKLLPLFDDESSQLREISIRLFKDVMKTVVGRQKKKMAKKVQSVLLPLFLHRNDQIKSVAKASRDTFVACTEFLGWRMANYMPEPYHTHLIGEFLLAHDRSRVEEYLCQSLPYLEDTQASMREAAVRFIGLGVKHPRNISKKKMREICNDGTLPEQENPEHPDLQAGRDADSTRLPPSLDSSDVMLVFEESLQPSQATDTVLVATEGPTADDFCARQMGSNVLDMAVRDPESWLMDARKMQVLLPDIMETLRHANTDVKMKSLVFFRNMMGHVKRKEASLIALQLAEKLLPLFDDESSQLREISIRLFKDVMKTVVGRQKKKMAKKVQSVLLPLFLHRNDQIKSVAKASRDTFVACTEFLGWRMANYMPEPYHTHLIGEFLLAHDRSRVEEYLCQSLPYLEDTQASMREAAVRFIGLGVKHPRNISKKKMREICNDGTLPEQENPEHPDLQAGRDADSTRLPPSLDSSDVMLVFEESLQPSQATDTVLVATEGPTADDFYARQMGSNVLDMAVRDPESWLMDARKMQVLLPDIMETLRHANTDVKMKSLVFFRNMMGHVKRKEASLIALQLAEKLLPLFDDESSQLREISIRLFKDVMKTVVGRQKKKMAKKVQSVLLPLFLHRNDQIKSVAKASRDTFVACTEFLGWRMANYMPEPYHTHLIGEFLLAHDRSRVEEYLCQSLPYLEDTQASMREAAVRFIGLGVKHPRNISKKKMREICNDGTLPEQENPEHPDLQAGRDADSTRLPPSLDSSDVMLVFEESLQPSQATDTVLVATEGPTADDFCARQMGSNVLDMAVRDPESWLMDARKMQVLLPDIMETLRHANTDVKMKSLVFFRNMMGHVKRKEASLIALQLAEKLLPLFDDESSQLREISIRLFKDVMKTVVGRQKKKMAKKVQSVLLPLFLHRNDQIKSVAKASRDTFVACTEFLGWRMANYMPEPYHTHLIGEFLLAHDRSRVEEYLCQSLPYLEDTQASMREAAVRFIGLGVKHPRNISKKKMREICNALQPLVEDTELSVRSLAAETIFVLSRKMQTSRWSLKSLCRWCC